MYGLRGFPLQDISVTEQRIWSASHCPGSLNYMRTQGFISAMPAILFAGAWEIFPSKWLNCYSAGQS